MDIQFVYQSLSYAARMLGSVERVEDIEQKASVFDHIDVCECYTLRKLIG
ncbi:MAG: hypothetical protein WAR83_08265 [Flavobacteriales bacterium]